MTIMSSNLKRVTLDKLSKPSGIYGECCRRTALRSQKFEKHFYKLSKFVEVHCTETMYNSELLMVKPVTIITSNSK